MPRTKLRLLLTGLILIILGISLDIIRGFSDKYLLIIIAGVIVLIVDLIVV